MIIRYKTQLIGLFFLSSLSFLSLDAQEIKDVDRKRLEAQELYYQACLKAMQKSPEEALRLFFKSDSISPNSASTLFEIARTYIDLKQNNKAELFLQRAYQLSPQDKDYLTYLAGFYAEQDQTQKAISLYEAWLKSKPKDEDVLLALGPLYYKMKDYEAILRTYNQIYTINRSNFEKSKACTKLLYNMYSSLKQTDQILPLCQRLFQDFPDRFEAREIYIKALIEQKAYSEVIKLTKQYLDAKDEGEFMWLKYRLYSLLAIDDLDETVQTLERYFQHKESTFAGKLQCLNQFMMSYKDNPKIDRFIPYYEQLIAEQKDNIEPYLRYAEFLKSRSEDNKVFALLSPLEKIHSNVPELWDLLLGSAITTQKAKTIANLCTKAIKYIKDDFRYYYFGAMTMATDKKYRQALSLIDKGLKVFHSDEGGNAPKLALLYSVQGDIYSMQGKEKKMMQAYEISLKYNPDYAEVLNNYAYHLSKKEQELDKAEQMSAKAVRIDSENMYYLDTYAWVLYQKKTYALAHLYMNKAVNIAEKEGKLSAIYCEHFAYILLSLNKKDEAKDYFQQSLQQYSLNLKAKGLTSAKKRELKAKMKTLLKELNKLNK